MVVASWIKKGVTRFSSFISKIGETCSMFKYWWNRGAIENTRWGAISRVKSLKGK